MHQLPITIGQVLAVGARQEGLRILQDGGAYLAKPYSAKPESAVQESAKPYLAKPGNC